DHLQEFWESERTASLADLAAYNEERAWVVGSWSSRWSRATNRDLPPVSHTAPSTRKRRTSTARIRLRTLATTSSVFVVVVLVESREQGKGKGKAVDSHEKGKGRAVDSAREGKGKAREVTSSTESSKLPRVTLRSPAARRLCFRARRGFQDASSRRMNARASFKSRRRAPRTISRESYVQPPRWYHRLPAPRHVPSARPSCWVRDLDDILPEVPASGAPPSALRNTEGHKIPQAVRAVLQDGCPCFTDPEDVRELRDLYCGEDEVRPLRFEYLRAYYAFLAYQHAYASHFDPVRGHLDPAFAAPFDFDKWYPPHFDYRTRVREEIGNSIPILEGRCCQGRRVDSVGSGDARSEAEDEDEKKRRRRRRTRWRWTSSAPYRHPVWLVGEPDTVLSSCLHWRFENGSGLQRPLHSCAFFAPARGFVVARTVGGPPLPPAEEPAPAEFTFTAATLLGGSSGHARRSWILHWAAEMDRIGDYRLDGNSWRRWCAILPLRSTPLLVPVAPHRLRKRSVPVPRAELTNDAGMAFDGAVQARSFMQNVGARHRAAMDADTEGRILRGEGREVLSSLPSNWDTANLWGFLAKQEAQVKRELVEARLDKDPSSLFPSRRVSTRNAFDVDLEGRATPVAWQPRRRSLSSSFAACGAGESTPHARLAGRASIDSRALREALRAAAPRHDNPWAQLALDVYSLATPDLSSAEVSRFVHAADAAASLDFLRLPLSPTQDEIPVRVQIWARHSPRPRSCGLVR
ncbi:hypothetical protein C8F04DRAFT_1260010, partial [Mycena alexandri]